MSDLLFRHVFNADFLDYYHAKVVETVSSFTKVLIYRDCVRSFDVVTMLIYSFVCLLSFKLPDVLSHIRRAFVAPRQVDCIFRSATRFLSYLKPFSASFVGKELRVNDMITAL